MESEASFDSTWPDSTLQQAPTCTHVPHSSDFSDTFRPKFCNPELKLGHLHSSQPSDGGGGVECLELQSKNDFLESTLKDAINITAAVLSLPSRDLRSAQLEKNTAWWAERPGIHPERHKICPGTSDSQNLTQKHTKPTKALARTNFITVANVQSDKRCFAYKKEHVIFWQITRSEHKKSWAR